MTLTFLTFIPALYILVTLSSNKTKLRKKRQFRSISRPQLGPQNIAVPISGIYKAPVLCSFQVQTSERTDSTRLTTSKFNIFWSVFHQLLWTINEAYKRTVDRQAHSFPLCNGQLWKYTKYCCSDQRSQSVNTSCFLEQNKATETQDKFLSSNYWILVLYINKHTPKRLYRSNDWAYLQKKFAAFTPKKKSEHGKLLYRVVFIKTRSWC